MLKNKKITEKEKERTEKLLALIPQKGDCALDAGARDGYISLKLTEYFKSVTALDLIKPKVYHERIRCEKGDITDLTYPDNSFDMVFCSEVLEHIPPEKLPVACNELTRVARNYLIIGVPYKQDIRFDRTTCQNCGRPNPPWGHVNTFDETKLQELFSDLKFQKVSFIGKNETKTNFLSVLLMDLAGNPFGVYHQKEVCIYCGAKFLPPPPRNLVQKICTKCAVILNKIQSKFVKPHPFWINFLAQKQ